MRIAKTKQTLRKREGRGRKAPYRLSRRSTPPFSPLLAMLGGDDNNSSRGRSDSSSSNNDKSGSGSNSGSSNSGSSNSGSRINWVTLLTELIDKAPESDKQAIADVVTYCTDKNLEKCDTLNIQRILLKLRQSGVSDKDLKNVEYIEEALDIIYIKDLKDGFLQELTELFVKADIHKTVRDVLSCIIYQINNPDATEFPTDLSAYYGILNTANILKNTTIVAKDDAEKLKKAQSQIAAAMWIKMVRTLETELNNSQQ